MEEDSKEKKRKTDFDDLQNEMAGREVGRIPRFLPEETRELAKGGNKKKKDGDRLERLFLLLHNDPGYAVLYHKV